MFNVGGPEFLIILLVALVVLGPTRLPDALRQVGKFIGEAKKLSSNFQNEVQEAMKDPVKKATGVELPKNSTEIVNKFGVGAPFSGQEKKDLAPRNVPPRTAPDAADSPTSEPTPNVEASIESAPPAEAGNPNPVVANGIDANAAVAEGAAAVQSNVVEPNSYAAPTNGSVEPSSIPPRVSGYEPVGEVGARVNGDGRNGLSTPKPMQSEDDDVPMFGDR